MSHFETDGPARPSTLSLWSAANVMGLAAALALIVTGWRYLTPLSGVTGAGGALLAMLGETALLLAAAVLARFKTGGVRTLFIVLSWLGAILTLIAVLFLHGTISAILLVIVMLALAAETFRLGPSSGARA